MPRLTALGSAGFSPLQCANWRGRWKISARVVGRAVKRRERRAPGPAAGWPAAKTGRAPWWPSARTPAAAANGSLGWTNGANLTLTLALTFYPLPRGEEMTVGRFQFCGGLSGQSSRGFSKNAGNGKVLAFGGGGQSSSLVVGTSGWLNWIFLKNAFIGVE